MARRIKEKKDLTSLVIAVVLHVILLGGAVFWAYKTGKLEQIRQAVLQYVRPDKKEEKKPEPIQQKAPPPPRLPPINQGRPPASGSGTRRAVAADAPEAQGGQSFFQDTRRQVQGPSTAGPGGPVQKGAASQPKSAPPPIPRPAFRAAPPSTIQQLLAERASEAATTEAFGSEQISRSGVSDAGAIVNKVAGASIVDGKFAVIRGLSDRYVTTTLNGAEIPSADPYRRSASLDLFPAQIIEKIVVAKTFTPDQPGTYTGGGINIVTKSFPERPIFSMSFGATYNTQATGNKHFLTYDGGGLDWAGIDDGTRALPARLSATDLAVPNPPFTSGLPTSANYNQRIAEAELLQSLTREMGVAQLGPVRSAPPANHNFSLAVGDTTHLFGRPLGYFAGLSYRRDFSFYEDGISRRYVPSGTPGEFAQRRNYNDTRAIGTVNWAGMVTLAHQLHPDHELGFNFLYNQNSEDIARAQFGTSQDDPGSTFLLNRLHFTQRNLNTFQIQGTHRFPEVGAAKLDWLAALSRTTQEEPDTRFFNFAEESGNFEVGKASVPDPKQPTRYFRDLDESNRNLKLDLTVPFRHWGTKQGELKLGVFHSSSERKFSDREVFYQGNAGFDGDPNSYLTEQDLGYTATTNASNGRITYNWNRYIAVRDSSYSAESKVQAGYVMLDTPVVDKLRLIGGVRYEATGLSVSSKSYLANSVTGRTANDSELSRVDLLPAGGLVYAVRTNMNLRLSYGKTVARPSFRELAGYRSYDPVLEDLLDGNPQLKMSEIENYDFRWEWFPRPGEVLGVSLFRKDLKNAIERRYLTIDAEIISFDNRETAKVTGIEFEARKSLKFIHPLLHQFTIGGNLSLIQSEVALTAAELNAKRGALGDVDQKRPLYDQSPYILNLDVNYDNPYSGTTASVLFNTSGPRVTIASLNSEDVFEQPAPGLDFVLSQKLNPRITIKFSARNLLNPRIERTYGKDSSLLYSSYRRGMTFGLSINVDL